MFRKKHAAAQGITASDSLETIYQREIFFPVDPRTLDWIDWDEFRAAHPSGSYLELNWEPLLRFLPELEAEIFWLLVVKNKYQKDVAKLLGLSQPTVSYRFRRVLTKLRYLMSLAEIPLREVLAQIPFLNEKEQGILYDLFYYLNQELVGKKHGVQQATVRWLYAKTRREITKLERAEPERWFKQQALMILLDQFFAIRIQY